MTSYPGTPPRILGRHYDIVSWDAIMTSYPGSIMTSYPAFMTSYPGTTL